MAPKAKKPNTPTVGRPPGEFGPLQSKALRLSERLVRFLEETQADEAGDFVERQIRECDSFRIWDATSR